MSNTDHKDDQNDSKIPERDGIRDIEQFVTNDGNLVPPLRGIPAPIGPFGPSAPRMPLQPNFPIPSGPNHPRQPIAPIGDPIPDPSQPPDFAPAEAPPIIPFRVQRYDTSSRIYGDFSDNDEKKTYNVNIM
jgi:hypothetical protein